jgi:hypothetical protein
MVDTSRWTEQLIAGGGPEAGSSATYPAVSTKLSGEGIAADSVGNVFFTEFSGQVAEISATDHVMRTTAGNATSTDSGDGGPATDAGIYLPTQICLSATRGIDIVDVFRIRSFTPGGNIVATAGNNFANYFGDNGPAIAAGLDLPSDVLSDSQGNIYVADKMNGLVRRIDATTGVITTIAGGGPFGVIGDGGPATGDSLTPFALALDQANHLYIRSEYGIRVVDLSTGTISTLISSGLTFSGSMIFDGGHTLYLASAPLGDDLNSEVAAIDINSGTMTTVAGTPHNGLGSRTDDGDPATNASMENVWGLALDGKGTLFISDEYSNNIRNVNLSTGIIRDRGRERRLARQLWRRRRPGNPGIPVCADRTHLRQRRASRLPGLRQRCHAPDRSQQQRHHHHRRQSRPRLRRRWRSGGGSDVLLPYRCYFRSQLQPLHRRYL